MRQKSFNGSFICSEKEIKERRHRVKATNMMPEHKAEEFTVLTSKRREEEVGHGVNVLVN
jgi:hypothetical protein